MSVRINVITCLIAMVASVLALGIPNGGVRAQDAGRIAAVVNDDAITLLDLYERTAIIFATTGLEDNQETRRRILPQVLRTLIDERLQLQEGRRAGLDDVIIEFDQAYRLVERNLGLPSGQLEPFMNYNDLSLESLNTQLKAEIIWSELVERRMQTDVITEDDIDAELDRLGAAADQPAYLLAEIYLAVDEPSREPEIEANMLRLREAILSGASFPIIARQFSQSASAIEGGGLGWIVESQLSEDLRAVVPQIPVGDISQPLRVIGGFTMILMRDRRIGFEATPDDSSLTLRQVIFPVSQDEADDVVRQEAVAAASALSTCDDLASLGAADPTLAVGSAVAVRLGDLEPSFGQAVAGLSVGEASVPLRTEQGFHVIVVCEREEGNNGLPSRSDIQADLEAIQFDLVARGYLRDLRRKSFVEIRI